MKKVYILIVLAVWISGCSSDSSSTEAVEFDQKVLFENLGTNLILPAYQDLVQKVTDLELAVNEFTATPNNIKLTSLREKYIDSYQAWQVASFYEFGPASAENLALSVNAYPTNAEEIDKNIQDNTSPQDNLEKGFPALDYLLFGIAENDDQIIEKYNSDALAENRKTYLKSVIVDLKKRINGTYDLWQGSYLQTFVTKEGNDAGSSLSLFVNAILSRYEADLKNSKFGIPAGVSVGQIEPLPEMVEAIYSNNSKALALTGITTFIEIFEGKNGTGLSDYLKELGTKASDGTPLEEKIISQLNDAKMQIQNLPETPLNEVIKSDKTPVADIYYTLQQAVIYLKTDMTSALSIQVSYQDGDGD